MPEHGWLRDVAAWLIDLAWFCSVVKPALLAIADFVLFLVGLGTVVWLLLLRLHWA